MSFLSDYFNLVGSNKESAVCCPFDHQGPDGTPYKETNPSAHVNIVDNLFHCKACGRGFNQVQFIQEVCDCSYQDARRIENCFANSTETEETWDEDMILTEASKQTALNLGISEEVIEELKIKTTHSDVNSDKISFPVFMFGTLVDVRSYNPGHKPKWKSRANTTTGFIIPFDKWVDSEKVTLLCAGEKDMAVARSYGFNAITFTGGEGALTKLGKYFTNRAVVICYDNDSAGINGAKRVANQLLKYTNSVKICTKFHEVCTEKGEDITDYFTKYNKTRADLVECIKQTPKYVPAPEDDIRNIPTMDLLQASTPKFIGKTVKSNIQVVAVSEATYTTPSVVIAEKWGEPAEGDLMKKGELRDWELKDENVEDLLHLIDNRFKETDVKKHLRDLMHILQKERSLSLKAIRRKTVFKCYVTDMYETTNADVQPMEYTAYVINCKLESGQKYLVTHKLVPHPYSGQQLIMLITDAVQAVDSVSNFVVNEDSKRLLDVIKNLDGTVEERINLMTEKVKGLLGYNGNNQLIQTMDLAYHTALQFNFGNFKAVRGYLDTLIIGESRVGKSSTAECLRQTYGLGMFASLAGNSATIPGLVGGSNKTANGFQTRAGIIPQNHKGLIIFEEFGKSNANVVKELTDIRSSNEVRITRVSGTIALPALVRMISLTNVKATDGAIKPIASYPNGISIVTELVGTAEDIARYDIIAILPDKGASQIDPLWVPAEPFDKEVYQNRIRWIWSRTAEQIKIDNTVALYIMEQANELNKTYDCHIKLFGTEAWKKITRLAIAVAGYLVSTEDYNDIIITKEHVDYAVKFLVNLYDNPTFKFKEYVDNEKLYSTINEDGVARLQDIYNAQPALILQLEQSATTSKQMLGAGSGLDGPDLNKVLKQLSQGLFIRFQNHTIIPTERFRLGLAKIDRRTINRRVGEG